MTKEKLYYSIPEAARTCGVSRATMWNWVKSGRVNAFVTPGGHHRIRREEMDRLLAGNGFAMETQTSAQTILVVDDDPTVRKTFKARLGREGYAVLTSTNGFEAGVIVSQRKPALVLLDLFMEEIDGFEVCRTIKNDPNLKQIKILAISGMNGAEIRTRIMREGADGFLSKDTEFSVMLDHIRTLLSKS